MGINVQTGADDRRGELSLEEQMREHVLPDLRDIVATRADEMREHIFNELWVNARVGNNPDGVRGPSQSTGRSASEWFATSGVGLSQMRIELVNPIDYAEYVHFPGDATGQCLEDVDRWLNEVAFKELEAELADFVRGFFGP